MLGVGRVDEARPFPGAHEDVRLVLEAAIGRDLLEKRLVEALPRLAVAQRLVGAAAAAAPHVGTGHAARDLVEERSSGNFRAAGLDESAKAARV